MRYEKNNLPAPIPIGRAENLINKHKNRLTILYRISSDTSRKAKWLAKCDCGNYVDVTTDNFKSGMVKSCGCLHSENAKQIGKMFKDLTNQRFGRLVALYPTNKRQNATIIWKCKCDCGNECEVSSTCLIHKKTQSCGCIISKNLTNQRFGKLKVLYPIQHGGAGVGIIWHCQCECGNFKDVPAKELLSGHTASCGCLKNSLGELNIKNILDKNNISYKEQYSFPNLKDKSKLRFDFAILNGNNQIIRLIEFDGKQHYEENKFFAQTLEEQNKKDNIKNQYCKDNNIPLVRIPYWERDNITLKMLLGKEYEI